MNFWGMNTACLFANISTMSNTRFSQRLSLGSGFGDWSVDPCDLTGPLIRTDTRTTKALLVARKQHNCQKHMEDKAALLGRGCSQNLYNTRQRNTFQSEEDCASNNGLQSWRISPDTRALFLSWLASTLQSSRFVWDWLWCQKFVSHVRPRCQMLHSRGGRGAFSTNNPGLGLTNIHFLTNETDHGIAAVTSLLGSFVVLYGY